MNRARRLAALLAAGLCACESYATVGSDCTLAECLDGESGATGTPPRLPSGPQASGDVDQLDLLFVIDNSMTMLEEQAALAKELPRLLKSLATGDTDTNPDREFHAVPDLHLGVVTTDLGLDGISDIENCAGLGNDGLLMGCPASGERFASATQASQTNALATDAICRSQVGISGCGFEQPLEASLRALSPPPEGHAEDGNQGFLRQDSLLVVVVLSDEEDCSMQDTRIITPAPSLDVTDPLRSQGLNVRCSQNPEALFPIGRYVEGLRGLRPGADDRVMFFAIAGVPVDAVGAGSLPAGTLEDEAKRERFYEAILDAPAMREAIDDRGTALPDDDVITPVCESEHGTAFPARRLVEVARGFGMNGLVQSICERDLSRPIDNIVRSIARRLGQER